MTRYLQRLQGQVQKEFFLIDIKITNLCIPTMNEMKGVYFKVTRGKTRVNGEKLYTITPEAFKLEIEEKFTL